MEHSGERPDPKSPPVATDDVEQLRLELARLRIENEILKKAAMYFARDSL
jgi:transposase-like protein